MEKESSILYLIRYTGLFAFIKPFAALRDERTMSSVYVPPTVIAGIEGHIFGNTAGRILRSRLVFSGISYQQEIVQTAGFNRLAGKRYERNKSTLSRGLLLYPQLTLGFKQLDWAQQAAQSWIMLSRREDIMLPQREIAQLTPELFDQLPGYECRERQSPGDGAVPMGYYESGKPRYVLLVGTMNPLLERIQDTDLTLNWL